MSNEFKIEIGTIFDDNNRNLIIIDREYREKERGKYIENRKWYKYKCNKCGYDKGWVIEHSLLNQKTGCACCCPSPIIVVEGINDIPTVAPWMTKYFQGGYDEAKLYNKSGQSKIYFICPDCGEVKDKPMKINSLFLNKSIGCQYCGDNYSYPNKIMLNVFTQSRSIFETEYSPDWLKPKRYDFYFEVDKNKQYIVEMDGKFHNFDNLMNGITAEENKKIDDYKDLKAQEQGIEVIRINCEESNIDYIKNNIISSRLSEIIDLSNINWVECEEFALSNLCKRICKFKTDNPNMSTLEISKSLKLCKATINKYLNKGTKIGWCNYDAKEENRKSGRAHGKKVEMFKDGISVGIFPSCNEIEVKSVELFGVKMRRTAISGVCNGKHKTHKGYTFKYI